MTRQNSRTDLIVKAEINLYYDVHVPETAGKGAPLLLAVHGYGAHKRYMMREAQAVAPENFAIASIQAPHQHFRPTGDGYRVGFGWLTDYKSEESVALHHRFALQVIEALSADETIDPQQIYLFGFSQACALNFRFALTFPEAIRGVVGVCGGIPGDLETNPQYKALDADVFYLYADDDEFYPLEKYKSYEEKLRARLPRLETRQYAAKHVITEPMREDVKVWLKEKAENPVRGFPLF
jgi:predicted esterase